MNKINIKKRVAIIGSGKWACQLRKYIEETDYLTCVGYIDDNKLVEGVICNDEEATLYYGKKFDAVFMGIGYAHLDLRKKIYDVYKTKGIPFATIVHPTAIISNSAEIGEGCLVGMNSIIEMGAMIADNVVIHSGVYIAHEVVVDKHCYITARAALAGDVKIGQCCFIGFNCSIRDGITIADNTVVGCSANVVKDITESGHVFIGNPARMLIK